MSESTFPANFQSDARDRLISFARACEVVGISRSQVYRLLEANAFPTPVKVGRNNFFSEREIQSWIQAQLGSRAPKRGEA